jgi:hypothetical protein
MFSFSPSINVEIVEREVRIEGEESRKVRRRGNIREVMRVRSIFKGNVREKGRNSVCKGEFRRVRATEDVNLIKMVKGGKVVRKKGNEVIIREATSFGVDTNDSGNIRSRRAMKKSANGTHTHTKKDTR